MAFTPDEVEALRRSPYISPGDLEKLLAAPAWPAPDPADDDDDGELDDAWLAGFLAEADAIVREDQAYSGAAAYDGELAGAELSNSAAAMGRVIAGQLARRGDIEGAIGAHAAAIELAGTSGQGSIELASRDSYGRFGSICGHDDGFGRCGAAFHQAGCGAVVESAAASGSAHDALAYREAITHRADALVVSGSVAYEDAGSGQPWTVRDQVYSAMGISPRESQFETGYGKPEAPEPRRQLAYGDPDDPASGKALMEPDRDLAERLGLAPRQTADDARRIGAERIVRQAFGQRGTSRGNLEGSPLEGSRTPAGRTAALGSYGDGVLGSQVALCNARDSWAGPYG
jgi:hypothetical protein